MRIRSHRRLVLLASLRTAIAAAIVGLCGLPPAFAGGWATGDVFVGVSNGVYQVYDNTGMLKETINTGLGGYTTGGGFNPVNGQLYGTAMLSNTVVAFDAAHPHAVVQSIVTGALGGIYPETVVFDAAGNFYVGFQTASSGIHKYNAAGVFQTAYFPTVEHIGVDELELAADGRTLFYSSEGRRILRYDVNTSTQLPDFALLPGSSQAAAVRLLPPFDGSGGLLVCDAIDIKRLDGSGAVVQTYDLTGDDGWFAMDLDPNGTSFWASSHQTADFCRFHIATGALEIGPINTGTGPTTVYGLIVMGGAVPLPGLFCFGDGSGTPCPCGNTSPPGANLGCTNSMGVGAGLAGTGVPSMSGDTVVLTGSGMPNSSALYLQGTGLVNGNSGVVFGDGLRCVGGSIIRLGLKQNTAGASQYPEPGDPSISVRGLVTTPGDRYYQVWYRNAPPFCTPGTFNLTNGQRITWVP